MMNIFPNQNYSINQLPSLLNQINNYMLKINEIILEMNNIINIHINSQNNNNFLNPINDIINNPNQNLNPVFQEEKKNLMSVVFNDNYSSPISVFVRNDLSEFDLLIIYFNRINRPDLIINYENELEFLYSGNRFGNINKKIKNLLVNGSSITVIHKRQQVPSP